MKIKDRPKKKSKKSASSNPKEFTSEARVGLSDESSAKDKIVNQSSEKNTELWNYMSQIYQDRWCELAAALAAPEKMIQRWNTHLSFSSINESLFNQAIKIGENLSLPFREHEKGQQPIRVSENDELDLLQFYVLDLASVFPPAACLIGKTYVESPRLLDICAAPGGKTLVLSELFPDMNELIANDVSTSRRERLTQVIRQYVPQNKRRKIHVKGKDGVWYGLNEPEQYDVILLDAPCSGERAYFRNEKDPREWTLKSAKFLSQKQYSLLCSAHLALKPGGRVVYSTCSINPLENDAVVAKVLKKRQDLKSVSLIWPELARFGAERTQFGWIFLPDQSGQGPIYFSVLEKSCT